MFWILWELMLNIAFLPLKDTYLKSHLPVYFMKLMADNRCRLHPSSRPPPPKKKKKSH